MLPGDLVTSKKKTTWGNGLPRCPHLISPTCDVPGSHSATKDVINDALKKTTRGTVKLKSKITNSSQNEVERGKGKSISEYVHVIKMSCYTATTFYSSFISIVSDTE